jgi:tetratricopeptide (TPR) repeat protein
VLAAILSEAELYDRSIAEARRAQEIDERHWFPYHHISRGFAFRGMFAEALDSAERAFQLAPWEPVSAGILAGILVRLGQNNRAAELLANIPRTAPGGRIIYHMLCAEIDAAAEWYQKAIELRAPWAALWASAGFLKPLRSSPRWPALARMMNLPG